ncbi:PREDICTED: uncharacterized protein LOC108379065 isoform X1 [Rhagoletis zephyria]|uniref:uncharacterized protein LOC108379065 isoform X1 n=1 Tax=Rhagoletis zephyria TaxID=28612 RepID=UPI0008116F3C|nr:PREDICTED: uncharacterized protein LOC108379065 isoform X1 [Rhagoletis zephyria]
MYHHQCCLCGIALVRVVFVGIARFVRSCRSRRRRRCGRHHRQHRSSGSGSHHSHRHRHRHRRRCRRRRRFRCRRHVGFCLFVAHKFFVLLLPSRLPTCRALCRPYEYFLLLLFRVLFDCLEPF